MILLLRGADHQASDSKEALVRRQPDIFVSFSLISVGLILLFIWFQLNFYYFSFLSLFVFIFSSSLLEDEQTFQFGVETASSTKEEVSKKKKIPRGWRNKKIPTEGFSPGMKVVLTSNPAWVYTVIRILFLEHIELRYGDTGKKFKVRGEELSPYDPPPQRS